MRVAQRLRCYHVVRFLIQIKKETNRLKCFLVYFYVYNILDSNTFGQVKRLDIGMNHSSSNEVGCYTCTVFQDFSRPFSSQTSASCTFLLVRLARMSTG